MGGIAGSDENEKEEEKKGPSLLESAMSWVWVNKSGVGNARSEGKMGF
jgi:hypothetical protein